MRLSRLDTVTPASIPAICGRFASAANALGDFLRRRASACSSAAASGRGTRVRTACGAGAAGRDDVIDAALDDGDVRRLLIAAERAQVAEISKVTVYPLHRLQWFAHLLPQLGALPLRDDVATTLDVEAGAEVVRQH